VKKDIENRDDVIFLVDTFYQSVQANKILGYIFNDVAQINWSKHLPKMYSFWANILPGEHSFSGNPMEKHISLSKITPLSEIEFSEWLLLFTKTVDELFEGKNADEAKLRAGNIARLMLHKIQTM
jgi:hemoglobin